MTIKRNTEEQVALLTELLKLTHGELYSKLDNGEPLPPGTYIVENGAEQVDKDFIIDDLQKSRVSFVEQFYSENIRPSLNFVLLNEKAVAPQRATKGAAGFDLTATEVSVVNGENGSPKLIIKTGVSVKIPDGYIGLLVSRSSVHKTGLQLANGVGVIDSDYTGELMFVFNSTAEAVVASWYDEGDRVGQLLVVKDSEVLLNQVESHEVTERGDGGFGSTGR